MTAKTSRFKRQGGDNGGVVFYQKEVCHGVCPFHGLQSTRSLRRNEKSGANGGIGPCVGGMLDVHFWQIPTACRQADTWVNVANLRVILSQERAVFNAVSRMKGELKKECFL